VLPQADLVAELTSLGLLEQSQMAGSGMSANAQFHHLSST